MKTNSEQKPQNTNVTAALVSVGGTTTPLLHVLRMHRPRHVWYFCSEQTRAIADQIQSQLEWHPAPRFIEVARFEELGPCYRELRRKIPDILAETKVPPAEVLVDYTGGTKTMSAALTLVAVELFEQFSYVGGKQRDKGGIGTVIGGEEKVLYQTNPWSELAIREIERACDLWSSCQFEIAAQVLHQVARRVPSRNRFETLATLADAMAARHRLDFSEACRHLHSAIGRLRIIFEANPSTSPLPFAEETHTICKECTQSTANNVLLRELLDNTLRTAAQGRYDDAAARLYRAIEMQAQLWLQELTNGLFINGRCKPEKTSQLPSTLKNLPYCQPDSRGEIKLSLEQCYQALAQLGHKRATHIVSDLALGHNSRLRSATEKRNSSILAHGVQPIGKDGFNEMKQIATDFLGFDLTREAHPIPPLQLHWFE